MGSFFIYAAHAASFKPVEHCRLHVATSFCSTTLLPYCAFCHMSESHTLLVSLALHVSCTFINHTDYCGARWHLKYV